MVTLKTQKERELYRKYHIPNCGNLSSIKLNAIFINKSEKKGYTKEHELMKFELAWEARGNGENFICEAARRATDQEREIFNIKKDKVADFVNLSQGQEYEIVNKHENDFQIHFYRDEGVIPILIGETYSCELCGGKFPRRSKSNICQRCKKIEENE